MYRSLLVLAIGTSLLSGCSTFKKRCDQPTPATAGAPPCSSCGNSGAAVYPAPPGGGYVPPTLPTGPTPDYNAPRR